MHRWGLLVGLAGWVAGCPSPAREENGPEACVPTGPEVCDGVDNNCDGRTDEGFYLDVDPLNCGMCGRSCPAGPYSHPICVLGTCDIRCEPGTENVDGDVENGCEATCLPTWDLDETFCDAIDNDCDGYTDEDYFGEPCGSGPCARDPVCHRGVEICEEGEPLSPTDTTCDGVDDDCDGRVDDDANCCRPVSSTDTTCDGVDDNCDGRVDDDANCGCRSNRDCDDGNPCTTDTCGPGNSCRFERAADGTRCGDGICCNGTCVDPASDPANCGRCGHSCGPAATCLAGSCQCEANRLNCDDSWANGCETDGSTDPRNCGHCGNQCGRNASCSAATCVCDTNRGNCDGTWENGCETSLLSRRNCGACGVVCELPNATTSCSTGTCTLVSCISPFGDCNGDPSDGCEVRMSAPQTCGPSCDSLVDCTALPNVRAGRCASRACEIGQCRGGYAECDDVVSNGCERLLNNNSGSCGTGSISMGTVSGDTIFSDPLTLSAWGETWRAVRVTDDDDFINTWMEVEVRLSGPEDMNYDLYVHGGGRCGSCVRSGTASGSNETVAVMWEDEDGVDDSRTIYIEVRVAGGGTLGCGEWTLTVRGNWGAAHPC